ncbi:MAG: DUF4339 domain-containing protein [Hyphomicrobium sp.]
MTAQINDIQWYIARDGKQHGPLSEIEMRTFVAHNYLRPTDLIWRPGMTDWQMAPAIFPSVFQAPAPQPMPTGAQAPYVPPQAAGAQPYGAAHGQPYAQHAQAGAHNGGMAGPHGGEHGIEHDAVVDARKGLGKRIVIAATLAAVIGGGAYGLYTQRDLLAKLTAAPPAGDRSEPAATSPSADTSVAAVPPDPAPAAAPVGPSALDQRLQKVAVWEMIKRDYPDWYTNQIASADKLAAEQKPESEVALNLAQGVVALRRQNAEKALSASPAKLKRMAETFLENLRDLQSQNVAACYGYISKGELSPAAVQMMQSPETATAFNAQMTAIFEAAAEGGASPTKHEAAVKGDYDLLIQELNKLGWKEEDLQVFSNPRLLAKRDPGQVCKMVQEWFIAHLAVQDATAQNRLLYETLKPVVSG